MQSRESSTPPSGAIAPVGQATMQRVQEPHVFRSGASGAISIVVAIAPSSTHGPNPGASSIVDLPSHPSPARAASGRSSSGP